MDLEFTPEEQAFRDDVRAYIAENYPAELRAKQDSGAELGREDYLSWHRVLAKKGWVAPAWPVKYGGPGWTPTQRYLFQEELGRADTVRILPFGVTMVGPVIYTFGNQAQKDRFLPGILSGEDWWCQGYSEPGSGSDLASLRTRAVRDGDHYIVNGSKTWTTLGQHADWIFCLVRTSTEGKPQEGISFLLIDMKTPGISVKPIILMDGKHEVNEVFFEDVKVPVENLVGEENKGWTYAKFLLMHERTGIAAVARSKQAVEKLKEIAALEQPGGVAMADDWGFARRLAELEVDLLALEYTELRALSKEAAGKGPGAESSMLKIRGSEIQQRITELAMEAVGPYGLVDAHGTADVGDNIAPLGPDHALGKANAYFNMRKTTIYGGTNEIQRNIIAKMVLGL
ncbi:MAG: acyl-CoA dehydrogenase family protein [Alphaproteobacteria bacterium]|nr:acyl-CoA dehydrogenase family protein [Alphaproteobacteria bacterium]MDX5370367.1 acyl-CoA dehydrogenase family protein [Alphaproteobacteria bacterium]MDX5464882.1 acyl-CoA dehydrogenase family protein [Alphaproteobacteria bacterium]